MFVFRAGIHKVLVRIANREDPDQMKKQSDLGLRSLSRPFWLATSVEILEHLPSLFCKTVIILYECVCTVKTLYNVTSFNRIFIIRRKIAGNRSVSIKIPSL